MSKPEFSATRMPTLPQISAYAADHQPSQLHFPASPSPVGHALRVWMQRCLLGAIQPLRWLGPSGAPGFGILTYHQVARGVVRDPAMLNVTPQRFCQQMEGLLQRGYEPWPLRRALKHHSGDQPLPSRAFVVVFDDGFENVYLNAWPVLRELNIPATVFLATAYLDQPYPFPFDTWSCSDRAHTLPEVWRPLRIEQCREMQKSGLVELGSHTHTHQDFRGRTEAFQADLEASLEFLQRQFGVDRPAFSFPYGFNDPELIAAARTAGVACGLSAECERVQPNTDPFGWGRFGAVQFEGPGSLAAKLDGWYCWARALWHKLRGPFNPSRRTSRQGTE